MSVSASIDIEPATRAQARASFVLPLMFSAGWRGHLPGKHEYLPLGDSDDYAWQIGRIRDQELLELVADKEANGETVGVVLAWEESGSGGAFLFSHDHIMLSITLERRQDCATGITDLSWYADRLLPALTGAGVEFTAVSLTHVR